MSFTDNIRSGAHITKNIEETADVVVIGSGAGGAVVAKELAEGGKKVIIFEEGGYFKTSQHRDLPYRAVNRLYRDKGFTATIGTPAIPVPMGKVFGGTTVINSGTCFRTPKRIFDHWAKDLGLSDLTQDSFTPYFERVEEEINVTEGKFDVMSRSNTIFHELLEKKGVHGKPLMRNIVNCEGCGFCCYGCPSGAKQSMDVSYLPKALNAGAVAYTHCKLDSLITRGKQVIGAIGELQDNAGKPTGFKLEVKAPIVIVAGGAIPSPQILRSNGIGVGNSNLGRNLSLHPATKVFAQFKEEIRGWEGTPQAYYLDILEDYGITFEGIFVPPDIAAMTVPFVGRRLNEFMRNYIHMASFGFMISDESRGRVVKLPFFGTTVLYTMSPADVDKIKMGVAYLARVFLEGGAEKVYTILHGHTELKTEADIQRLENSGLKAEDIECMAFHPLGTCRMGTSAKNGVVDTRYKVFGWEGIYVCDGSVIPSSLGVNPQVTIMAFATRLASQLLNKTLTSRKSSESERRSLIAKSQSMISTAHIDPIA